MKTRAQTRAELTVLAKPPNLIAGLIASGIIAAGGAVLVGLPGMALLELAQWIGERFGYDVQGPMGPSALGVAILLALGWIWPFVPTSWLLHRRDPKMRRWVRGLAAFGACVLWGLALAFLFSLLPY